MVMVARNVEVVDKTLKPFALPIGLASPMWLAFGAATSASVTWWWMSRWTRLFRQPASVAPVQAPATPTLVPPLDMITGTTPSAAVALIDAEPVEAPVEPFETQPIPIIEAVMPAPVTSMDIQLLEAPAEPVDTQPIPIDENPPLAPLALIEAAPVEFVEPPVIQTAPTVRPLEEPPFERPDELTLLRGVGPRVADALVARGVTTFAQLAAWSDHDMAKLDTELKLLGRSKRYDFLGQARELAAQPEPAA